MTVTREELLRAANESSDDTERLVYADWLEENGEVAHAQAIHLQCELARTGRFDRRRRELEWELAAVLDELGDRWAAHLPTLDRIEWLALERGLPHAVRAEDVGALIAHHDEIIAAAPTVTHVELGRMEVGSTLVEVPWLRSLRITGALGGNPMFSIPDEIEIDTGEYDDHDWITREDDRPLAGLSIRNNASVGDALAENLGNATWARGLRTLRIPTSRAEGPASYYDADPRMTATGAAALVRLEALEVLQVDRHDLGAKPVERLLALPKLREFSARETGLAKLALAKLAGDPIEVLDLSQNAIGTAGAQAIAKAPRMRQLQRLVLDTCEIEALGLVELVRSPIWNTLRWLDLSRNPLGIAGARALAEAPKPEHLATLHLSDADFDDAAANTLGKVGWLGQLVELELSGNPMRRGALALRNIEPDNLRRLALMSIGMERTEAAALSKFWPKLVHLDLGDNAIGDAGIERFATTKEASALQSLGLWKCGLGDDGLELLARARCPRLRSLQLWGNKLTGAGIAMLLAAPIMSRVTSLDLRHCELDAKSIAVIARTPMPRALVHLDLRANDLDEQALLVLAESPTLRAVKQLRLDGNPFTYDPRSRERLQDRFGADWYRA